MADAIEPYRSGMWLNLSRIAIAGVFTIIISSIMLITPERYHRTITWEQLEIAEKMGEKQAIIVRDRTNRLYGNLVVDSGLEKLLIDIGTPEEKYEKLGVPEVNKSIDRLLRITDNVIMMLYQMCLRLSSLTMWIWFFIGVSVPLIADGYYEREKKSYEFGASSVNTFRMLKKMLSSGLLVIVYYVITPTIEVSWFVWLPGIIFMCSSLIFRQMVIRYHKMF
jgi:hypothetical protein